MATVPVILVAVDGSEQSMHTVAYLSRVLSPKNVGIELFHVLAEAPESFYDQGETEGTADFETPIEKWKGGSALRMDQFMDEARKALTDAGFPSGSITVSIQPRKSGIARDIINKSAVGCAAVAIGRKGFGTLPDFMMGNIAAKLADSIALVPLVIVGGRPETRKVVVGFDRSRGIRKGLDQVGPLLSRKLEQILLCHIVRPLSGPHLARKSYFSSREEAHWLDENSRKIVPVLVDAKQRLSRAGFDQKAFHTAIIKEKTSRAEGLRAEAEALGAGTIILGRRGATSVEEFAMGRVTRKILYMVYDRAIWIV
jgi:nucleotide-binding universal stress UspA family protein